MYLNLHLDNTCTYIDLIGLFAAAKAVSPKQWLGKLVIKSKNNQHKISIPYKASVLHG